MFSIKSFFLAVMTFSAVFFSVYAGPKPSATMSNSGIDQWVPVDESDWTAYMGAPSYHFTLAREYLQKATIRKRLLN